MSWIRLVNFSALRSKTLFFIAAAYVFSVVCRLDWIYWASEFGEFFWNGELMISTNDGYAFGEGARDMLAGFHQPNDLSYFGVSLSALSYVITSVFGVNLEKVMLYLSVFASSLIALPLVLIMREIGATRAGFIAALLGSIANSYYNRTMAGYYDTDMLTIVLPVFAIWGLVRARENGGAGAYLITALSMLVYSWWYASSFSLNFALIVAFSAYSAIFARNRASLTMILFMLLAASWLEFSVKFSLIVALFLFVKFGAKFNTNRVFAVIFLAGVLIFSYFGGLNPIWFNIKFYFLRSFSEAQSSFHFFNVNDTIMESGIIDFGFFAQRISGHILVFLVSLLGYLWLCVKKPVFLVALPMVGLGFLALKGGLRFTIYAVPIMALGFGYALNSLALIIRVNSASRKAFLWGVSALSFAPVLFWGYIQLRNGAIVGEFKFLLPIFVLIYVAYYLLNRKNLPAMALFAAVFYALIPSLIHIYSYKATTVLYNSEVAVLDELSRKAGREDYVVTWWDYGYAVRYYSDVKTLIDGGKHLGKDNFAVSFALSKPPLPSANMSRLEVEYTERGWDANYSSNLSQMLIDYDASDVDEFLLGLNSGLNLPPKTREIYYFLPDRMIGILPTITKFSRLDIKTGTSYAEPFIVGSENYLQEENHIRLDNGILLSNDVSHISYGGARFAVNTYVRTAYDGQGRLQKDVYKINENAKLYVIFMEDYGRFLILDKEIFDSTYIQLFVLENYENTSFEPVILKPSAKVYKLKL